MIYKSLLWALGAATALPASVKATQEEESPVVRNVVSERRGRHGDIQKSVTEF